jgi:hypothetical protein
MAGRRQSMGATRTVDVNLHHSSALELHRFLAPYVPSPPSTARLLVLREALCAAPRPPDARTRNSRAPHTAAGVGFAS